MGFTAGAYNHFLRKNPPPLPVLKKSRFWGSLPLRILQLAEPGGPEPGFLIGGGQPVSAASIIAQWREASLSYDCGVRVRCALARRSSCGRGPGAQPPEFFWDIIPSRVPFYNRVHFFTPVFKILKVVLYIELLRVLSRHHAF